MPVSMPHAPEFLVQHGRVNVTLHTSGESTKLLVFSRIEEDGLAAFLGIATALWDRKANSVIEKRFAKGNIATMLIGLDDVDSLRPLIHFYSSAPASSPTSLLEKLTVRTGRELLTGHLIALRTTGKGLELPSEPISYTAKRFQELLNWGETSAAFVLSNLLELPLPTIHSRIRLAKQRELLKSPGTPVRRQSK